ncbi:MAG: virulence factor family protein, partial [Mesorhizobium sp.]
MTRIARIWKGAALATLIAAAASLPSAAEEARFDTGMIPSPHILLPKQDASGL